MMRILMPWYGNTRGLTTVEILLGVFILSVAGLGIAGAYMSQATLNEHAYNLTRAGYDAVRVMEQIRLQNNDGCALPSAAVAGGWDGWLVDQDPGKSTLIADVDTNQQVMVTCEDEDGGDPCGSNQVAEDEWSVAEADSNFDPIQVTVSVCWRHRGRIYGECAWNGATLVADDVDGDGVVSSPVMLTTLVTCRS
jgi:Tfp pilus assembly protein PilV